jgi:hypothetical protein
MLDDPLYISEQVYETMVSSPSVVVNGEPEFCVF